MQKLPLNQLAYCVLLAGSTSFACSSESTDAGTGGTTAVAGTTSTAGTMSAGGTVSAGGTTNVAGANVAGANVAGANVAGANVAGAMNVAGRAGAGGSGGMSGGTGGSGGKTGGGGLGGATAGAAGSLGGGAGAAGGPAAGGSGGSTGSIPLKNTPEKSAGCGKATQVTSGEKMIMSKGMQRSYTIDIPANYDMNKPYKLVYASHWIGSNDESVVRQGFYHLKPKATAANESVIFVAPQALPGDPNGTWNSTQPAFNDVDHVFFDDILAFVKSNLCIDTTRVFAIGFSFGGMMTYSLSRNHQTDIRAAVGIAPANYNISKPANTGRPIAWMQTTGLSDGTCPWDRNGGGETDGAKFIALEHAKNNGCMTPTDVPTWKSGSFLCYDFQGCNPSHPTKACTFNGGHVSSDNQPWIADEAWKFFMQF